MCFFTSNDDEDLAAHCERVLLGAEHWERVAAGFPRHASKYEVRALAAGRQISDMSFVHNSPPLPI